MVMAKSINEEPKPISIYICVLELILLLGYYRLQCPAVAVPAVRVQKVPDWLGKKQVYQSHPHRKINFISNGHLLQKGINFSVGKQFLKLRVKPSGFHFGVSCKPIKYGVELL